jgi:hypothetical protein
MPSVVPEVPRSGIPAADPLGEPVRIRETTFHAETMVEHGSKADAHKPDVREAIARSLYNLLSIGRRFVEDAEPLGRSWFTNVPKARVFPLPHSPLFDFEGTRQGAEWIDAIAREARDDGSASGELIIGHFDWRVEHLRFSGGAVVASFDWDSLHIETEPVIVGAAAHAFTADWSRDEVDPVPSVSEVFAFIDAYERCRAHGFTAEERGQVFASLLYSLAYTARCAHALHPSDEGKRADFRPLLRVVRNAIFRDHGRWTRRATEEQGPR